MRPSPTISIPRKTTDEVDWITPLKHYIRSTHQDPQSFSEECSMIHHLRQSVRGAERNNTGRDLIYKYYAQLELLELRVPVATTTENGVGEEGVKISFPWHDAFTGALTTQSSLAFEKASLLFNLGATLSAIASTIDRTDPDGAKRSYAAFQSAAGCFAFVDENFLHAPSNDLSREILTKLRTIMLAQAQEVFLEYTLAGGKAKPTLISKLAGQAAFYYTQALEDLQEHVNSGVIEGVWHRLCTLKQKYMTSIAHFYAGTIDSDNGEAGRALAHLAVAETTAKEALRLTTSLGYSPSQSLGADGTSVLAEILKNWTQTVTELHARTEKDNDFVYHHLVPKEESLPPLGKMSAVKSTPLTEMYGKDTDLQKIIGGDIFHKLVPLSVHASSSMYSEEKAKMLRAETERVEVADEEVRSGIEYLGLPATLAGYKFAEEERILEELATPTGDVRRMAAEVAEMEKDGKVEGMMETLKTLKAKVGEAVRGIELTLDEEARECESMRARYQEKWTQPPAAAHPKAKDIRRELVSYKESLEKATESDGRLMSLWGVHRADFEILREGAEGAALDAAFGDAAIRATTMTPTPTQEKSLLDLDFGDQTPRMDVKRVAGEIEQLLGTLEILKRERTNTLKDLRERAHSDDISDVLILNKRHPGGEKEVFRHELEKFRPYSQRISATIAKGEDVLGEISARFKALNEDSGARKQRKRWDGLRRGRDQSTRRFGDAYDAYKDVREGVKRGVEFYTELNDILTKLKSDVDVYIGERRQEGKRIFDGLQARGPESDQEALRRRLAGLNVQSPPAVPPQVSSSPYVPAGYGAGAPSYQGYGAGGYGQAPPPPQLQGGAYGAAPGGYAPHYGARAPPPPPGKQSGYGGGW
ncbi:bck1-like resistance to osmotic shock [Saitoella coloradoensis]